MDCNSKFAAGQSVDGTGVSPCSDAPIASSASVSGDSSDAKTFTHAKSEFVGTMSHEIQTRMNQIIGMMELTLATPLTEEQDEYLKVMKSAANSLLDLLNGFLDFSKIETGDVRTEMINFNLRDSLQNPLKTLACTAEASGLRFVCRIDDNVPNALVGDPARLRQILVNLLGHEIQTTMEGDVYLGISLELHTDDRVGLHFTIGDTGLPPGSGQSENAIFFSDAGSALKFEGDDINWAVTLQIIKLMGGEVRIQRNRQVPDGPPPDGLRNVLEFVLWFKPQERPSGEMQSAEPLCLKDIPVLIVDDCPTDRQRLQDMLELWEMKPQAARHALEAMVMLEKAHAAGKPFPLVIADANMREVDGFDLAKEIRQSPNLVGTKMVLLTSAAMRGDGQRCRELGILAYLPKPVDQSDLLHVVMAVMGGYGEDDSEATLITRHWLKEHQVRLRVLLVEDNPMNRKFVLRLLEKWGHEVIVAGRDPESIHDAAARPIDLMLMDISGPDTEIAEVVRMIRTQENVTGRAVRIVAMTVNMSEETQTHCRNAGIDDCLRKPLRIDELYNVIKKAVVAVGAGAPSSRPSDR